MGKDRPEKCYSLPKKGGRGQTRCRTSGTKISHQKEYSVEWTLRSKSTPRRSRRYTKGASSIRRDNEEQQTFKGKIISKNNRSLGREGWANQKPLDSRRVITGGPMLDRQGLASK